MIQRLEVQQRFLHLALAIPYVGRRAGSFAQYADAGLREVLGPEASNAAIVQANSLDHMLFLSRGGGFEAVPLPGDAQLAPAFYAGVADFDGDGHEDLFLSQNFSSTDVTTPPYDAGRGLWLWGNGTGRLAAVPGSVSGVKVYGDAGDDRAADRAVGALAGWSRVEHAHSAGGSRHHSVTPLTCALAPLATRRVPSGEPRGVG